jgi:hypothetical protein
VEDLFVSLNLPRNQASGTGVLARIEPLRDSHFRRRSNSRFDSGTYNTQKGMEGDREF